MYIREKLLAELECTKNYPYVDFTQASDIRPSLIAITLLSRQYLLFQLIPQTPFSSCRICSYKIFQLVTVWWSPSTTNPMSCNLFRTNLALASSNIQPSLFCQKELQYHVVPSVKEQYNFSLGCLRTLFLRNSINFYIFVFGMSTEHI